MKLTEEQRIELVGMVIRGELDDRVQEILAERRVADKKDKKLVYWEKHFPGFGEGLMKVLAPFYEWEPELYPSSFETENMVLRAIFWKEPKGVKFYPPEQLDVMYHCMDEPLWDSFRGVMVGRMIDALNEEDAFKLRGLLRQSLWDNLEPKLRENLKNQILKILKELAWTKITIDVGEHVWPQLWDAYSLRLALDLGQVIFYACGFVLLGDEDNVARMQGWLNLYLQGVIPMGISSSGEVMILCLV